MLDKGFGTQQIEEELKVLFPHVKIRRMDHDTTRKKNSYSAIIDDFERGNTDILIGTQMVTKGLDFDNVSLVGVLDADAMLKFPDFRSFRKNLSIDESGGRVDQVEKGERGKVVIQTYDENHEIIQLVKNHKYKLMSQKQLEERRLFKYPPYCRLILVNLQHKDQNKLDILSKKFAKSLKNSFGSRVLGPVDPVISKIRNYYHKNIMLKIESDSFY